MLPAGRDDRLANALLVCRTPRGRDLLDPCRGREARGAEPPEGVPRELRARDAGTAGIHHEPAQALGERRCLRNPATDLCRRDLGATLRVAPSAMLGQ